jgi:hypothetical protein
MPIWWLDTHDKNNVKTGTLELGYHFYGVPLKDTLIQPKVEFRALSYTPKDFVSFSTPTAFLVSHRVADFLDKNFHDHIELIQFPDIKGRPYYLVNVIRLIGDCVDLERSNVDWDDKGKIRNIDGHIFKNSCINGPEIFKVKEFPNSVFVTDQFKLLLESHKFTGMEFIRPEVTLRDLFYGTF